MQEAKEQWVERCHGTASLLMIVIINGSAKGSTVVVQLTIIVSIEGFGVQNGPLTSLKHPSEGI